MTDLKKYYGTEPNVTKALDGFSLSIDEGEFVAIVGTFSSGKSILLNMMGVWTFRLPAMSESGERSCQD